MNWAVQLMEQTLWISEHKKKADDRVDFFLNKVWEEPMGMTDSCHPLQGDLNLPYLSLRNVLWHS